MEVKAFELRDAGTFVPVLAIRLNPANEPERYLLGRAGYGTSAERQATYVVMLGANDLAAKYSPLDWGDNRSRQVAHQHITDNWDKLTSGMVVDVQYILGETDKPKASEAYEVPYSLGPPDIELDHDT